MPASPYIGQIMLAGFNFAPSGWAVCDGQLLAISEYDALFALIGTTYGGDGQTTFGLPDLRGRVPIHLGQGPGLSSYTIGELAGVETVTLTPPQIPVHTHSVNVTNLSASLKCATGPGNQQSPVGNVHALEAAGATMPYSSAPADAAMNPNAVDITGVTPTGGTQAHDNMQPFLTMNFCISLFGIFPSQT